jgi:hypothetical protein
MSQLQNRFFVSIGAKSSSIGKKNAKKTKTFLSKDLGDGLGKYFSLH